MTNSKEGIIISEKILTMKKAISTTEIAFSNI